MPVLQRELLLQTTQQNREAFLLAGLLLLKFLLHYLLVNPAYDLHRDEFLHLDQANHLAAGYLSVPPFTSWVAWLIKALGNTVFWVRFFPALFGALTIWVVWETVRQLGGGLYAKILAASAVLISAMLRLNMLFQPNSVDILAWSLVFYLLIRYVNSRHSRNLLWLGAVVGFGILNKYNLLFLLLGLFPALLLTPHRRIFTNPWMYVAMALAGLLVLPNIIW
ncbi:MAG: glycosyltransferase family 39 protein [Rufibacter sp.]